jgi:Predicted integral membrane protein
VADIFLSYAHADRARAQWLSSRLEAFGYSVWWDPNIVGGVRFQKTIEAELRESKAVVVCWSKASIESHWVIDEASFGRDENRLVPISLDGSQPPLGFRQFQVLDFAHWRNGRAEAVSKLLQALEPLMKSGSSGPKTKAPSRTLSFKSPRSWRLIAAAMIIAILAIGVAMFARKVFIENTRASQAVAVLALDDLGGSPETARIAHVAPRVIADLLGEYGQQVVPADASLAFAHTNHKAAARDLSAGYIVDGDVRMGPDKTIVLTLHLFDATGRHLWSRPFNAQANEADYLPDQAGTLLASLLTKKDQFNNPGFVFADDSQKFRNERFLEAYVQAKQDLAASPTTPFLMLKEAALGGLALAEIPAEQRAGLVRALRAQVKRASEMDPSIDARWGIDALIPSTEWRAREKMLADWRAFNSPNSTALAGTSLFLAQTGRVADAVHPAEQSIAARPLSSLRLSILGDSYLNAGLYRQAQEAMAQARRRWPEQPSIPRIEFIADLLDNKTEEAAALLANPRLRDQIDPPASVQPATLFLRAAQSRSVADEDALAGSCRDKERLTYPILSMCLIALNVVGRTDDAFKLADQIFPDLSGSTPQEREAKWLRNPQVIVDHGPTLFTVATAPMRRDRRFVGLMNRLGLIEYWRSSGHWPDFCKTEPRSVCKELQAR